MIDRIARKRIGKKSYLIYKLGLGYIFQLIYISDQMQKERSVLLKKSLSLSKDELQLPKWKLEYLLKKKYKIDVLKDNIIIDMMNICKKFTNVPDWKLSAWKNFNPNRIVELFQMVIEVNLGKKENEVNLGKKENEKKSGNESREFLDSVYDYVHLLAYNYGWTNDYILENVTFHDAMKLISRIETSNLNKYNMTAIAYHDPKQLKSINDKKNHIENMSLSEILQKKKKFDTSKMSKEERAHYERYHKDDANLINEKKEEKSFTGDF